MEHGKKWTYVKYKCRCDACVAANDAYMEAYRKKNKAKILAKEKERYRRKSESIIDRMSAYYDRERSKILERQKFPAALLQRRMNQKNREARKAGQFVESVNHATVYWLHEARCGICRKSIVGDFQLDHIVPLSRGGLHCYRNAQVAHPKCNARKHNRLPTLEELEAF